MKNRNKLGIVLFLLGEILTGICQAQNFGLGINPSRVEVAVQPDTEQTISFKVDAPPSEKEVRGRLLLSLTDWTVSEETTLAFSDPGTHTDSASKWVVFSPAAFSIASGQSQLVRVTLRVPKETAPGTYRTAIFVQERPPAQLPKTGEHNVFFRFRYVFTLYVLVGPVAGHGELTDARLRLDKGGLRIVCEMKNTGSRHVRPLVSWSLLKDQQEVRSIKNEEAMVVLPGLATKQPFDIGGPVTPGNYELLVTANFQDGSPAQAVRRSVEVPALPPPAKTAPPTTP